MRFNVIAITFLLLLFGSLSAHATIFGSVLGIVHDPQHRPVKDAQIQITSASSDWKQATTTDQNGEFLFSSVPIGQYKVSAAATGFAAMSQPVQVFSASARVIHFPLAVATVQQQVEVTAEPSTIDPQSSTTANVISRDEIARTPGADNPNSMSMITDYVPGSTIVHDQLHIRGGHQVSWLLDGVPVPNTNIASNVGPQFDPKDIDYIEVQRGGYSAQYGDRTYGVFNVVTRSGFERNRAGEAVVNYGSFNTTSDQLSFGDHTERFAYYASVNANRTDLGLETPVPEVLHDMNSGVSGFASLIFNQTPADQLRLVTSLRSDHYQIPNAPDDQQNGIRDLEQERDALVNFSWVHTAGKGLVLTLSPFYHFNRAAYQGGNSDFPLIPEEDRGSSYFGGIVNAAWVTGKHNARAGLQVFGQRDNVLFALTATDDSGLALRQREQPLGNTEVAYLEDQFKLTSWLTLNGGVRLTHFSGTINENSADPRAGAALRIPKIGWVLRGFYGRYYQAPPLTTVSGPLETFALTQGVGFLPLRGERDEQHEFGLAIPLRGWSFDLSHFRTGARNFFDHDVIGNSNIFLPVTLDHARIRGWEASVRSPKLLGIAHLHLAYSHQYAQAAGGVSGGLTDFQPTADNSYFFLDHDQRNTLSTGAEIDLPWSAWMSTNVSYGSGFLDGNGPAHLPTHASGDIALGKKLGESWSVQVSALNLANNRYLLDNSNTFGGTHYADPRRVTIQARYRFHY